MPTPQLQEGTSSTPDQTDTSWQSELNAPPVEPEPDPETINISDEEFSHIQNLYPEMQNLDIDSVPKVTVFAPHGTPRNSQSFLTSAVYTFILALMLWQTAFNVSDTAMSYLLSYMYYFFTLLGCGNAAYAELARFFPNSLHMCKKMLGLSSIDEFKKYVVCPNPECSQLYDINDCYRIHRGMKVPIKCTRAIYKRGKFSGRCDTTLLQANVVKNGGVYHVPKKVYCHKDVTSQIETIMKRPGYEKYCRDWKERKSVPGTYEDIYDGKVWKEVQDDYGFFANDHDMGLLMNFDFFQPFKNRNKSVGVIYLALLNLPRSIRYHSSNMIVAGIIPSLDYIDHTGKTKHEPKSMNNFLRPLVDELNELWRIGRPIDTFEHPNGVLMHAMLLCVSCDSPASRKLVGFLSHSALKGCTKCYHEFKGKVGEKTYHGYEKHLWEPRDNNTHRKHCNAIRNAQNEKQKGDLETKHGCRYSVLLDLDYFDAIRHNAIDAMHNLYLGIAKSFFELLVEKEILTDVKLAMITKNLEEMYTNSGKSWLPKNIGSHWKCFNAFEWKQWTLVYSLPALRKVIAPEYLKIWSIFVEACQLISKPCPSQEDIDQADSKFSEYIKALQGKFGYQAVKPNHHMSCHLKQTIEDFGGVYTTWLFAFERLNGYLGDYKTNYKGIEITLMRKVLADSMLATKSFDLPKTFFDSCSLPPSKTCIFKPNELKHLSQRSKEAAQMPISKCQDKWSEISHIKLPEAVMQASYRPKFLLRIDVDDVDLLYKMYSVLYPNSGLRPSDLAVLTRKCDSVIIGGERFNAGSTNESKLCMVLANWCDDDGLIDIETQNVRLGLVKYFFHHNVRISGQSKSHIICAVQWYSTFHDTLPTGYLPPVQVFRKKRIRPGPASFMPVQRIQFKCAYAFKEINAYKDCIVVSPIPFDLYM